MNKHLHIRLALVALFAAAPLLLPDMAMAQKLRSTSAPAPLPDPVAGQGTDFTPAMATATTAYVGPPRLSQDNSCTEYNPCALPSSAPRTSAPLVARERATPSHEARAQEPPATSASDKPGGG